MALCGKDGEVLALVASSFFATVVANVAEIYEKNQKAGVGSFPW